MARNFLALSESYRKMNAGGNRTKARLQRMQAILQLMDEDKGYALTVSSKHASEMVDVPQGSVPRYLGLIKGIAGFFREKESSRNRLEAQLRSSESQDDRSILLAIEAFRKDGIRSWEDIEEAFRRMETPVELDRSAKPVVSLEPSLEKKAAEELADQQEQAEAKIVPEVETVLAPIRTLFSELYQARHERDELSKELGECADDLVIRSTQLERAQSQVRAFGTEAEVLKTNVEKFRTASLQLAEKLKQGRARYNALAETAKAHAAEIGDLQRQLAELRARTPDQLTAHLLEVTARLEKQLAMGREQQQSLLVETKAPKSESKTKEYPTYSSCYDRPIEYSDNAFAYMTSLGKKSQRVIRNKLQILADQGCGYAAIDPKKIEGGDHNGKKQITAGRFRIFWEERPDCIYIDDVFRKGERRDHIRE